MLVALLAAYVLSGCSTQSPYVSSTARMQQASQMNSAIVENAVTTLQCPKGYRIVGEDVTMDKKVYSKYKEIGGRGRRSNNYFPRAEHEAGDVTQGKMRLKCERIPVSME
ncbi:MAG: hypothetical protein RL097_670 [Candidatus Parcubacteria bacterium]